MSNGLDFSFGEENPLLVLTQDGLTHKTRPEDYRITASGVDIRLSKDILRITSYNVCYTKLLRGVTELRTSEGFYDYHAKS